jgi:uncharacterized protein YndB with AHSA1/START domain
MSSTPSTDTSSETTAVRAGIDVAAPPERAFEVFTKGMNTWWNRDHHVLPGTLSWIGVEPRQGGRLLEEMESGETCEWGRVLTWDPPRLFAFSWLVGPDWGVPAPDAPSSTVTVMFTPTPGGTRVELVHDQLDAHGPGWESVRAGVGSDGGWPKGLRDFAAAAQTPAA